MPRKIGSKNKIKESNVCKVINLNKNIKNSCIGSTSWKYFNSIR